MSRKQPDIVLIVPGEGRWVYSWPLYCVEYFPFGAQRPHYRDEWGKFDDKNTRKHALKRALKLELKRQEGKLPDMGPMN